METFSGGEIRMNAGEAKRPLHGTEVWNRDPLPKPLPPKVYTYQLTVQHPKAEPGMSFARATATSFEALIAFELQMKELGYEFIKLERLGEE